MRGGRERERRAPFLRTVRHVSLHACGGLSDYILKNCGDMSISFCICTCCYMSNPFLRTVTLCDSVEDYRVLAKTAETDDFPDEIQDLATRIINNCRISNYFDSKAYNVKTIRNIIKGKDYII